MKEEQQQQQQQDEEHGEEDGEEREEQHEEKARRGKRKVEGTTEPPCRNSVRAAGSRSLTMESSKRQRIASVAGTREQCGGSGAAAAQEKTSTRTTARRHRQGKRFCQEACCTRRASYGKAGSKVKHAEKGMVDISNAKRQG